MAVEGPDRLALRQFLDVSAAALRQRREFTIQLLMRMELNRFRDLSFPRISLFQIRSAFLRSIRGDHWGPNASH